VRTTPELKVVTKEPTEGAIGETLRETRESLRIGLAQAEQATRIRRDYLQALERDDFAALPGSAYVKGFLRNYGRFLGLDPETLVGRYQALVGDREKRVSTAPAIQPIRHPRPLTATLLVVIFMVILASAFAYYLVNQLARYEATRRALAPPTPAASASILPAYEPSPSVAPTPAPTPAPPRASVEVEATTDDRVWLQVEVDDKEVANGTFPAGTTWKWQGSSKILIWTGNAPHLLVKVNGKDLGPLGTESVVKKTFEKSS
jgi:cytoskeletal protein RodZ